MTRSAVALGSVLATAIGVLSGYFGGRLDLLLQRGVDAWMNMLGDAPCLP